MSDVCNCPFSDMEIDDLKGLEQDVLVRQSIRWLVALSYNTSNVAKIIAIANYLPSKVECAKIINLDDKNNKIKENFDSAFFSIRFAINYLISHGLYKEKKEIAKNLFEILDTHTQEGVSFWRDKLLRIMKEEPEMKSSQVWIMYQERIKNIIDIFAFSEKEDFKPLIEKALDDGYLEFLVNWRDWSTRKIGIKSLIELFNLSQMNVLGHLEDLIDKRFQFCLEVSQMAEAEVESTKKLNNLPFSYLSECILIEKRYFDSFDEEKYQKHADNLMKISNKNSSVEIREILVQLATHVYSHMEVRKKIIKIPDTYPEEKTNKTIFIASKVIGFKYKKQGLWDIHIGR